MAKAAKQVDVEITPKIVNGIVKDVLEGFDQIESARGKFMNAARRQRELIAAVYERGASHGIPQKVMKLEIKIIQLQAKLTGAITELDVEQRKMLQKVVKARGDKAQLALFTDLPPAPPAPKAEKPKAEKAAKPKADKAEKADAKPAEASPAVEARDDNVHHLGAA